MPKGISWLGIATLPLGPARGPSTGPLFKPHSIPVLRLNCPENLEKAARHLRAWHIGLKTLKMITAFLQVAVKVLTKKRGSQARGKVLRKIAREIDLLTKLQECCNVIQLLTVYEDEEHAYLVCELCKGGDLEKILLVNAISFNQQCR